MSNQPQLDETRETGKRPAKATWRSIAGDVSVRQVPSRWDRANQVLVTVASLGALLASIIIGFAGCMQQENQSNAIVDADRQNTAFQALSAVRDFYDSGQRNLAAVQQYRKSKGASQQFTSTAGQNFDDAWQTASSALSMAALKSVGYPSHKSLLHMRDVLGEAHAGIAFFYNQATVTGMAGEYEITSDKDFEQASKTAYSALTAVSYALQNTESIVACDFGYKNGAGAQGFSGCPVSPVPEPTVSLPPGTTTTR